MKGTLAERSIEGLNDYAIWLRERGDKTDLSARTREERKKPSRRHQPVSQKRASIIETSLMIWENSRLREWRESGRLASDGTLRISDEGYQSWTLKKIERAFPELNYWDRWAVLIAVGGIFREDEMSKDPHHNIREVIEQIVDIRLKHVLREEVSDIFEQVLTQVKDDAPIKDSERSTLSAGRKIQKHRVRHPKTKELVSQEEKDAYLAMNTTAA